MKVTFEKFFKKHTTEEWLLQLKNNSVVENYSKNERIFNEGDFVKGVYFINNGKVKIVSNSNENMLLLRLSTSGDLVGHRGLFSIRYPVSAYALSETQVTFIPLEFFKKLIKNNSSFSFYIIEFLAQDLKNTEEHMKSIINDDVVIRVAMIIRILIDTFGYDEKNPKKLHYTLSRTDLANYAGTTYESVIRNLAKLEEMKIIQLDKKTIHILKEKKIKRIDRFKENLNLISNLSHVFIKKVIIK